MIDVGKRKVHEALVGHTHTKHTHTSTHLSLNEELLVTESIGDM